MHAVDAPMDLDAWTRGRRDGRREFSEMKDWVGTLNLLFSIGAWIALTMTQIN